MIGCGDHPVAGLSWVLLSLCWVLILIEALQYLVFLAPYLGCWLLLSLGFLRGSLSERKFIEEEHKDCLVKPSRIQFPLCSSFRLIAIAPLWSRRGCVCHYGFEDETPKEQLPWYIVCLIWPLSGYLWASQAKTLSCNIFSPHLGMLWGVTCPDSLKICCRCLTSHYLHRDC